MTNAVTELKVDDEAFLVASLIDRCPKAMMLRELVQNAIEAVTQAPSDQRRIVIDTVEVEGGKKLRIRNNGPGLDRQNLYRMCDLAASIGKIKGLDKNFGMGAKVASLPSNNHGVRYRSCSRGEVYEVTIGKRGGVYGRIVRPPADGTGMAADIANVTEVAKAEGYDLSLDWTEVTLLGMRPSQNTAQDPYDGDPTVSPQWLPETLYNRYFRIPEGVEIRIAGEFLAQRSERGFESVLQRAPTAFARYECVNAPDGVRIHYLYDPTDPDQPWENQSSQGALQAAAGQTAIVFRNEIYDRNFGPSWAYDGPEYGITFGARNFSAYIELPDGYPAWPDTYRQNLFRTSGAGEHLWTRNFAAQVLVLRPAWLLELLQTMSGGNEVSSSVLDSLLGLKSVLNPAALLFAEGAPLEDEGGGVWTPETGGDFVSGEQPRSNRRINMSISKPILGFEIVLLHNAQEIQERWLRGRAGCYYPSTRQLFLNTHYTAVAEMHRLILRMCTDIAGVEGLDGAAQQAAIDCLVLRAGRCLLFGLAKQDDEDNWQPGHIEKAISPESLSVSADDFHELTQWAVRQVRQRVGGAAPAIAVTA